VPVRRTWQKLREGFLHILHLDDSAHRIALGAAIGMFVAVTPTWGIQMLLVVGLAWLLRANKVAGLPMVWLTNPATNVPVYSFCYLVGQALVGGPSLAQFKEALAASMDPGLSWRVAAAAWWDMMLGAAAPIWVGCLVVGAALGVVTYALFYYAVTAYRRRRGHGDAGRAPGSAGGAGGP
jgi:uncharacterized protein (DUF2062 family)